MGLREKSTVNLFQLLDDYLAVHRTRLIEVFREFDKDRNGKLERHEVTSLACRILPQVTDLQLKYFKVMMLSYGHGKVTYKELAHAFRECRYASSVVMQMPPTEIGLPMRTKSTWDRTGSGDDGLLTLRDTLTQLRKSICSQRKSIQDIFKRYDYDRSGYLTLDELSTMFRELIPGLSTRKLRLALANMTLLDSDADGRLSYREVAQALQDSSGKPDHNLEISEGITSISLGAGLITEKTHGEHASDSSDCEGSCKNAAIHMSTSVPDNKADPEVKSSAEQEQSIPNTIASQERRRGDEWTAAQSMMLQTQLGQIREPELLTAVINHGHLRSSKAYSAALPSPPKELVESMCKSLPPHNQSAFQQEEIITSYDAGAQIYPWDSQQSIGEGNGPRMLDPIDKIPSIRYSTESTDISKDPSQKSVDTGTNYVIEYESMACTRHEERETISADTEDTICIKSIGVQNATPAVQENIEEEQSKPSVNSFSEAKEEEESVSNERSQSPTEMSDAKAENSSVTQIQSATTTAIATVPAEAGISEGPKTLIENVVEDTLGEDAAADASSRMEPVSIESVTGLDSTETEYILTLEREFLDALDRLNEDNDLGTKDNRDTSAAEDCSNSHSRMTLVSSATQEERNYEQPDSLIGGQPIREPKSTDSYPSIENFFIRSINSKGDCSNQADHEYGSQHVSNRFEIDTVGNTAQYRHTSAYQTTGESLYCGTFQQERQQVPCEDQATYADVSKCFSNLEPAISPSLVDANTDSSWYHNLQDGELSLGATAPHPDLNEVVREMHEIESSFLERLAQLQKLSRTKRRLPSFASAVGR